MFGNVFVGIFALLLVVLLVVLLAVYLGYKRHKQRHRFGEYSPSRAELEIGPYSNLTDENEKERLI